MSKILVAYFSASGVTREVAEKICKAVEGDLFEIVPETPYSKEDLDYTNKESRCSVEMNDLDCRPAVASKVEDMCCYDTVFVGFPVWWGREPSIVDTFLCGYDFSGKRIIPFCTSGTSGIGSTAERIRSLVGDGAKVDDGDRLDAKISDDWLCEWLGGLKL